MAYITKEEVKAKSKALALLNKMYGVKASFSGSNSGKLTLTIHSGRLDFLGNALEVSENDFLANGRQKQNVQSSVKQGYIQANHYYLNTSFSGVCLGYLQQAYEIMKDGHYDNSDIQVDHFDCAWYNAIVIGRWNKPYTVEAQKNHFVIS